MKIWMRLVVHLKRKEVMSVKDWFRETVLIIYSSFEANVNC